jgi:uncharacterized membrane protein YqhA
LNRAQENILEVILQKSKYLTILTVVITLLCALVLYLITSVAAIMAIYEALTSGDWSTTTTKVMAVTLLKVVDMFLICIGLQVIAAGVYKLFINDQITLPAAMSPNSFTELKLSLVRISSLVLLIMFVERAVDLGPSRELLEYGIAIAVIMIAASWGSQTMDTGKDNKPQI